MHSHYRTGRCDTEFPGTRREKESKKSAQRGLFWSSGETYALRTYYSVDKAYSERERETERQRETQTDRQTDRDTKRDREKETEKGQQKDVYFGETYYS